MVNVTLVATFYNVPPLLPAAVEFRPKKVILLVNSMKGEVRRNIETARKALGRLIEVESVRVPTDDVYAIARRVVKIIDKEATKDNRVIVNVSGGWRLGTNGVLYGCYARSDRIFKIVSNTPPENRIMELPKLSYNLSTVKRDVLSKAAQRGSKSISQLAKEMRRTRGMVYQHLRELKGMGYIDNDFNITDAGRLALL